MAQQYRLTIGTQSYVVSEKTALKASSGREIPVEGLTLETKTENIADPDHVSKKGSATIRPINS